MTRKMGRRLVGAFVLAVLWPHAASAQSVITGVVRDTSGAVLPGVTVEAASPALIERQRTAVTDGNGQYRIIDLRPGSYVVTFSLAGFNTVRREGIETTGTATATVNADMRVGGLQETITVTGESPIVDVQGITQQRAITAELLQAVPTGRTVHNMAALIPGMIVTATGIPGQDVGGSTAGALQQVAIHGGRTGDQRVMMDGLPLNSAQGNSTGFVPNMASTQEFTVDTSGVSAEDNSGGVRMNIVPREGGNTPSGTLFIDGATSAMQSSNYSDRLAARGFAAPNPPKSLRSTTAMNAGVGGPILRDRLWFYTGLNRTHTREQRAVFPNRNAGNPEAWTYVPDPTAERPDSEVLLRGINTRLTWQATPKHKLAGFFDTQTRCLCPEITPNASPEAARNSAYPLQRFVSLTWTAPITRRFLLDAALLNRQNNWGDSAQEGISPALIRVTDTELGLDYRGRGEYPSTSNSNNNIRGALSYVTGSHAAKFGFTSIWAAHKPRFTSNTANLNYRFAGGVPNQITMFADPRGSDNRMLDVGMFAQDRWTLGRATATAGIRYDYVSTYFPAQSIGPAPLAPTRNLSIPKTDFVKWKDITPRMGVAYDLTGNGRTAVKATLNKYLGAAAASGQFGANGNPLNRLPTSTTRSWNDIDRDFTPDCDLLIPQANGECGPMGSAAFAAQTVAEQNFDPDIVEGWGVRQYNWEMGLSAQHEVVQRVSVELAYFRRWYGNFVVTDNLAVSAADFHRFSITAPAHPDLPGGGGYTIGNLYNVQPASFGQVSNLVTLASKYGDQSERWHGVDLTANIRRFRGLMLQGGLSTGNTLTDSCEVRAKLPETAATDPYCRVKTRFLTQIKALATYTVPRIDVLVSAGFQTVPGPQVLANYTATNAVVSPSLGRPLAGSAANVTVNLVEPGTTYGDRLNQLDLRVGKILRFGRLRSSVNVDLFNVFNEDTILTQLNNFGPSWRRPQFVLPGRLAKVSAQVDF